MKKLRILVDMDSVLVNLSEKWYKLFNENHDKKLSDETQKDYEFSELTVEEKSDLLNYLNRNNFFLKLKPFDNSIEVLKKLNEQGHDIIIVTTPPSLGTNWKSIKDKTLWIHNNLPFLSPVSNHIVFTKKKSLIRGDILFDDSPKNIVKFREAGGIVCCMDYLYNRDVTADYRIKNTEWTKFFDIIQEISNKL